MDQAREPEASLGAAYYPGNQAWKAEPGNRYAPEELDQMAAGWDIRIINPDRPDSRSAD